MLISQNKSINLIPLPSLIVTYIFLENIYNNLFLKEQKYCNSYIMSVERDNDYYYKEPKPRNLGMPSPMRLFFLLYCNWLDTAFAFIFNFIFPFKF